MKLQFIFVVFCIVGWADACTETTAGGTHAPAAGSFCSGDLIFEDNFDVLDTEKWRHDVTMGGGGNWEFQWYSKDPINSYTENGILHLKPTFTADSFSEEFLISGRVVIPPEECTQGEWDGCDRQGTPDQPINPIRSARIDSSNSFHFKYGKLEVRAKNPSGDWIWPAIWAYPKHIVYGGWPLSGEIDLMETRGNEALYTGGNINVGTQQIGSTLHFGPQWNVNAYSTAHYSRNRIPAFSENFHNYTLIWTPTMLQFQIDNSVVGTIDAREGFWKRGGSLFEDSGLPNPWTEGTIMAPFDQEFFVIINNAVGGTNGYFSDSLENRSGHPKAWSNNSPRPRADFWERRDWWEPTWNLTPDSSHFQIDYVRVWAL